MQVNNLVMKNRMLSYC